MTNNDYPRLCGGTFFILVLQALRQRMKAREHYKGESDGLKDPNVLVGLIKVTQTIRNLPVMRLREKLTISNPVKLRLASIFLLEIP